MQSLVYHTHSLLVSFPEERNHILWVEVLENCISGVIMLILLIW